MMSFCEFLLEACLQFLLQLYVVQIRYQAIRHWNWNQFLSIILSSLTIVLTLTKVIMPQVVGRKQGSSNMHGLKEKVWQLVLNFMLFYSFKYTFIYLFHLPLENYIFFFTLSFVS